MNWTEKAGRDHNWWLYFRFQVRIILGSISETELSWSWARASSAGLDVGIIDVAKGSWSKTFAHADSKARKELENMGMGMH